MEDSAENVARPWWAAEDWLAVWLGGVLLVASLAAVVLHRELVTPTDATAVVNPLAPWLAKPQAWTDNPLAAFFTVSPRATTASLGATLLVSLAAFGWAAARSGTGWSQFARAFVVVFLLGGIALALSVQQTIKFYNLEYALWALAIGLAVSNTIGTPHWLRPAVRTELYIKTGLVLLGATMLFGKLLALGPRGLCVAWVVTPIVLVTTYWFGQRVLRIQSKTLNMVVSADMSVCGVSAAIATAAACRAKKEELSLAIGISLAFTVVMMVVMPQVIRAAGIDPLVGGAWIGGTIDSTGAVVAAGEMVGAEAGEVAVTIKMIQNILIGVTAFGVALYWVRFVERGATGARPDAMEIWRRFPKFVLGFLAASAAFSLLATTERGEAIADAALRGGTEILRNWFFALAFVSIGLESNFRELGKYLRGGGPMILYLCGQSFNLALTLLVAWLVFG